jgi:hypothetical protein
LRGLLLATGQLPAMKPGPLRRQLLGKTCDKFNRGNGGHAPVRQRLAAAIPLYDTQSPPILDFTNAYSIFNMQDVT